MPVIDIDNDMFRFLQQNATPFVDTPNSALRRLLNLSLFELPGESGHPDAPELEWPRLGASGMPLMAPSEDRPMPNQDDIRHELQADSSRPDFL